MNTYSYTYAFRAFRPALLAAIALHIILFLWAAWQLRPLADSFHFRSVNIKLGESAGVRKSSSMTPAQREKMKRILQQKIAALSSTEPVTKAGSMVPLSKDKIMKDFHRQQAEQSSSDGGSQLGDANATDTIRRYEQAISLWLKEFEFYPESAISQNLEGKGTVLIRINRAGDVLAYQVDQSTGSAILDAAMAQIVEYANPFPAVWPDYYPGQQEFMFKFQLKFKVPQRP